MQTEEQRRNCQSFAIALVDWFRMTPEERVILGPTAYDYYRLRKESGEWNIETVNQTPDEINQL